MRMWSSILVVGIVASLCGSGYGTFNKNGREESDAKNRWRNENRGVGKGPAVHPDYSNGRSYEYRRDDRNYASLNQHEEEHGKNDQPFERSQYDRIRDFDSQRSIEDLEYYKKDTARTNTGWNGEWNGNGGKWDSTDGEIYYNGPQRHGGGGKSTHHNNGKWIQDGYKGYYGQQSHGGGGKPTHHKNEKWNNEKWNNEKWIDENGEHNYDQHRHGGEGKPTHHTGKWNRHTHRDGKLYGNYDESKKTSTQYSASVASGSSENVRKGDDHDSQKRFTVAVAGSKQITQENQNRGFRNC